jgi:hypothetical protein
VQESVRETAELPKNCGVLRPQISYAIMAALGGKLTLEFSRAVYANVSPFQQS